MSKPILSNLPTHQSMPFKLAIVRGQVKGFILHSFNCFFDIFDSDVLEGLSNFGDYNWRDGFGEINAVSTSDEDRPGGNGVKNLLIYGLDGGGNLRDEPVELELSGTDVVTKTGVDWLKNGIYLVKCNDLGGGSAQEDSNDGDITLKIGTEIGDTVALIKAGEGVSRNMYGTIPSNMKGRIEDFYGSFSSRLTDSNVAIQLDYREDSSKAWKMIIKNSCSARNSGNTEELAFPELEAGTQIRARGIALGAANPTGLDVVAQILLIANPEE